MTSRGMFPLGDSSEATLGSQRKTQKIQLPILPSRAQVISNNSNKSDIHPIFTGSELALRKSSLEARNPDIDSDTARSRVGVGYDRCYRHASRKSWRFDRCHQEGRTPFELAFQGIRSGHPAWRLCQGRRLYRLVRVCQGSPRSSRP